MQLLYCCLIGQVLIVGELQPASWYELLVTAHNEAGFTEEDYQFATLTPSGGTIPPPLAGTRQVRPLSVLLLFVNTVVVVVVAIRPQSIAACDRIAGRICTSVQHTTSGFEGVARFFKTLHSLRSRFRSRCLPPFYGEYG